MGGWITDNCIDDGWVDGLRITVCMTDGWMDYGWVDGLRITV